MIANSLAVARKIFSSTTLKQDSIVKLWTALGAFLAMYLASMLELLFKSELKAAE